MNNEQFEDLVDRLEAACDRLIEPTIDPKDRIPITELRRKLDAADISHVSDKVLLAALRDLSWDVGRVDVTDPKSGRRGKVQAIKSARWQPGK